MVGAILNACNNLFIDAAANETASAFVRSKIKEKFDDPGDAETLSPRDYPFGTKRACPDSGYCDAFNRSIVLWSMSALSPLWR